MRRALLATCVCLSACVGTIIEPPAPMDGGVVLEDGGVVPPGDGGTVDQSGCAVEQLLATRCASCHGNPPSNGAPVTLMWLSSLRAPSQLDATRTNAERSLIRMHAGEMPPGAPASPDEVAQLEVWVAAGMPACTNTDAGVVTDGGVVEEQSPNLLPQDALFQCTGAQSDAPTRLRRLDRWQVTRNVGGAVTRSWTGFSFYDNPFDPSGGDPYSTWTRDESVDEATVELFLPIIVEAGPPWAGPYTGDNRLERLRLDASLRCMYQNDHPTPACVRHYLSEFLTHGVYFRPPRTDELDRLQAFATTVLAQEGDAGTSVRTQTITRISNAAWLTTGALFREEMGEATDAGRVSLTAWELAQQLTYAVASRGPGATPLWKYPDYSAGPEGHLADVGEAAVDGGIFDDAVVDALFRRHAAGTDATRFDLVQDWGPGKRSTRGEYWLGDGLSRFFREWLGYADVGAIFKEFPEATSAFDDGGAANGYRPQLSSFGNLFSGYYGDESLMTQQLDDVIARVVVEDRDVLKKLLTTRQFYLPSTQNTGNYENAVLWTGQVYGTEAFIADAPGARWVTMPTDERAGVLTHPAFLGAHAGNFEDDPSAVHRGKWIRENLLCGYVPPLSSVRVMAQVGPHAADKNARARLEEATAGQQCQGCHALMNPLGLPFETYNHAGYLRVRDRAPDAGWMPPNGAATLSGLPDPTLNGPVRDAVELSEKLADSPWVKRCFVRQTFRYFMGRPENLTDACTLTQMEQAYDSSQGSFLTMVSSLMKSDTWKTRRTATEGE